MLKDYSIGDIIVGTSESRYPGQLFEIVGFLAGEDEPIDEIVMDLLPKSNPAHTIFYQLYSFKPGRGSHFRHATPKDIDNFKILSLIQ